VAFAVCLLLGCPAQRFEGGAQTEGELPPAKILLFAVDGLEWSVVLPLVQRGELPTFAALMRRGVFGRLRTIEPLASPVIWTTIATGKPPAEHGITDFTFEEPTPEGPRRELFSSGHRRTKAFWNILSDAGLSVDVIGWWITYPAEPVRGLMVSQTNTLKAIRKGSLKEGVGGQVWPPEREAATLAIAREVDARLPEILREAYGTPIHPLGELEAFLWQKSQWSFRADEIYQRIALERLREPASSLTAIYMGAPDVVGHRFWSHAFPALYRHPPPPEQVENFGGLLHATYRRVDRALAALLERMPADTTVWLMSDHGMQARPGGVRFSTEAGHRLSGNHSPRALLIAAGPGIRAREREGGEIGALELADLPELGSVVDTLPTLLAILGVGVGEDMQGSVLTDLIEPRWLAARPVQRVATWDTPDWTRARDALRVAEPGREERLEQLRALGYIE
jgi:hypothetical protein